MEIPKKLSDVKSSSDVISPLGQENSTMSFSFTLGSGSLIPPAERKDRPTNSNIIDEMQIRVEDLSGKQLGVIYQESLLLLGTYKFTWDGRDIYGNYFLKDGTYKWVVAAVESNNDENNPKVEDAAKVEGTFKVVNAPSTTVSVKAEKDTFYQADVVGTSLNFNSEKHITKFKTVFTFNPNVISVKSVEPGNLVTQLADSVDFSTKVDNVTGEVEISIETKNGKYITGNGSIVELKVSGKLFGSTNLGFRNSSVVDNKGNIVPCVFSPGYITVKKANNPWDLNRDKKVDGKDLAMFGKAFGSEAKDSNYLPLADFNFDGVIDGKDLIVLAQHFGETYP